MGWGDFFGGIGKLLGKVPIQERKERWKNELESLTQERSSIIIGKCDEKKADRIIVIDKRIAYLNQLLKNSTDAS